VWVPRIGWHEALASPLPWISLILPMFIIALIIGAIGRRMSGR
jgi:hypothetical protein